MEVPGSGRSSLRIEARGWVVQPAPGKQLKLSRVPQPTCIQIHVSWGTGQLKLDLRHDPAVAPGKAGELIVKGEEGLVESRVTLPSPGGTVERLQVMREYFSVF